MTQREESHGYRDPDTTIGMNVADPVDCLTNLPGLLGHYPDESLVLVIGDTDLEQPGPILVRTLDGDELGAVRHAAREMADEGHERADVYVISRTWDFIVDGSPSPLPLVADVISEAGLEVVHFAGVHRLRAGEAVVDIDGGELGAIGDPVRCWASQRLHDSGEAIAADAEALHDRFRPEPAAFRIGAGEALRRANADVREPRRVGRTTRASAGAAASADGEAMAEVRSHHLEWLELVAAVDRGDVSADDALTSPQHLRTLARPLVSLLLRDMTMGVILGAAAPTARALWLGSARLFRGTARANALACYAIDRCVHGSPSIAKAALNAALETDPGHSLSQLLLAAMSSGRGEEALRSMLQATEDIIGAVHPDGAGHFDDDAPSPGGFRGTGRA
ncbi:hypothetical protein CJ204_10710 [Corynebacterium xerosis]|uniref:DUF4192 domain-containing protein n=1 Tax=Corynebacterium xerosis TaxID=1725 RepID=A0A2N6SWQ5_9CORY|nr:DUF4192 domain-containing protein [Corynebacterium xerosis]PMC61501.1 hypothetical protein CJ204_10710 [Corynebacterium xerosis]